MAGAPMPPDLPGLGVAGSTRGEVEQLIREGIAIHLACILEDGDSIPEPRAEPWAEPVDVAIPTTAG